MTRWSAAAVTAGVLLASCTGGGSAETTDAPAATVSPPTTAAPATEATTSSVTTSTTEHVADGDGVADCSALEDRTVELWQGFFAALGTMDAGDLGSERWIEIDATHAIPLENHGIETEAAGCGSARLMLCTRLGELDPGGGLAEFFLGMVADECAG